MTPRFLSMCGLLLASVGCSQRDPSPPPEPSTAEAPQPETEASGDADVEDAADAADVEATSEAACADLNASNLATVEALATSIGETLGTPVAFEKGWNGDADADGCELIVTGDGVALALGDRPPAPGKEAAQTMDGPKTSPWQIWRFNRLHVEAVLASHELSPSGPGATGVTEQMDEFALGSLRCNLTSGFDVDDWSICDGALGLCEALDSVPPEEQTHRYRLRCFEVAQEGG